MLLKSTDYFKISTIYHMEDGRIFNAFETFHKPNANHKINFAEFYDYYDPNPLAKLRPTHEIYRRYERTLSHEADCIQSVKMADREVREFLQVTSAFLVVKCK